MRDHGTRLLTLALGCWSTDIKPATPVPVYNPPKTNPNMRIKKKPGRKRKHRRRHKTQRSTFEFADDVPGVTFYCQLDAGPPEVCGSPKVYENLKRGRHTFSVKSANALGAESIPQTVGFFVGKR